MHRRTAMSRAVLLLGLPALLAGCDYFRPADPEPAPPGSVIVPDYSHPDSTLSMIGRAFADKGKTNGGTVYEGAFADSPSTSPRAYRQFFWPDDAAAWEQSSGQQAPAWTLPLELTFYNRFINLRGDLYHLVWSEDDSNPDEERGDVAFIHRRYLLTTLTRDSTVTSTLAVGYADLELARGSDGNWRIVIWQDRRDPGVDDPEAVTLGRRRLNSAS